MFYYYNFLSLKKWSLLYISYDTSIYVRLISEIFDKASPTRKNQLLKILISDCKLNGKVLEYKVKAPFDKLVQCNDYKQISSVVIEHLDEFEDVKVWGYRLLYKTNTIHYYFDFFPLFLLSLFVFP